MRELNEEADLFSNPLKRSMTFFNFDPLDSSNTLNNPKAFKSSYLGSRQNENKENSYRNAGDEEYDNRNRKNLLFPLKASQPFANQNSNIKRMGLNSNTFSFSKSLQVKEKRTKIHDDKYEEEIEEVNDFDRPLVHSKTTQIKAKMAPTKINASAGLKSVGELRKYQKYF